MQAKYFYLSTLFFLSCVSVHISASEVIHIPLDEQINLTPSDPCFDAIYVNEDVGWMEFMPADETEWEGYLRYHLNGGSSYAKIYLDLIFTGFDHIDITHPEARIEFDLRYYYDPQTDTGSQNNEIWLRFYEVLPEDSIKYGTRKSFEYPRGNYPVWKHYVWDINEIFEGPFNPENVGRIMIYFKDATGLGNNHFDVKNIRFYPEGNHCTLTADMTHDCRVDMYELFLLGTQWLQSGTRGNYDYEADIFGDDGRVDLLDFEMLTGQWQSVSP